MAFYNLTNLSKNLDDLKNRKMPDNFEKISKIRKLEKFSLKEILDKEIKIYFFPFFNLGKED